METYSFSTHAESERNVLLLLTLSRPMLFTSWLIAALLALAGLALLALFLRGSPAAGLCPACKYDLRALQAARCPECGIDLARARPGRRRRLRTALVGVLLLMPLIGLAALHLFPRQAERAIVACLPARSTAVDVHSGAADISIQRVFELPSFLADFLRVHGVEVTPIARDDLLRITARGQLILEHRDWMISLGEGALDNSKPFGVCEDIDGDNIPDLIVGAYSGGAHCCSTYFIVQLGQSPGLVGTISAQNGAGFQRSKGPTGELETIITTDDDIWNYWHASYVGSARPVVILRLSRGVLSIAVDLMRQPLPDSAQLAADAARIRAALEARVGEGIVEPSDLDPGYELWRIPLDLMHSGHEPEAWAFFDEAWPDAVPGKAKFLAEFKANLENSRYWPDIRAAYARQP